MSISLLSTDGKEKSESIGKKTSRPSPESFNSIYTPNRTCYPAIAYNIFSGIIEFRSVRMPSSSILISASIQLAPESSKALINRAISIEYQVKGIMSLQGCCPDSTSCAIVLRRSTSCSSWAWFFRTLHRPGWENNV